MRETKLYRVIPKKTQPDGSVRDVFLFVKAGIFFGLTHEEMVQFRDLLNQHIERYDDASDSS